MIFIEFGLLRSLYCKISYLLAEKHWSHTNLGIWQPTYDSVCEDNSWIHGKCRQRFLSNVYKRFLFSPRFFTFFNVFFNFHLNVYYIYGHKWVPAMVTATAKEETALQLALLPGLLAYWRSRLEGPADLSGSALVCLIGLTLARRKRRKADCHRNRLML